MEAERSAEKKAVDGDRETLAAQVEGQLEHHLAFSSPANFLPSHSSPTQNVHSVFASHCAVRSCIPFFPETISVLT